MFDTLMNICNQNKYVSIYTDNSSKFTFGRIIGVNQDHIAIYMISPDGFFDGIVARLTEEITRVEIDGQYLDKMNKLMSLCELDSFEYSVDDNNIFESLLLSAQKAKQIVSLEIMNSGYDDIVGFVSNVENGVCTVKQVDEYGFEDGVSFVKVEDITQISCASQDENRILKLWKLNYEQLV